MLKCCELKYIEIDNVSAICRHCNISRQEFYNIRDGKCEPSVYTALAIADYLGKDIRYLFKIY